MAFLFLIDKETFEIQKNQIKGMDDADKAKWIKISELENMELAFDHKKILKDALCLHVDFNSNKKNNEHIA